MQLRIEHDDPSRLPDYKGLEAVASAQKTAILLQMGDEVKGRAVLDLDYEVAHTELPKLTHYLSRLLLQDSGSVEHSTVHAAYHLGVILSKYLHPCTGWEQGLGMFQGDDPRDARETRDNIFSYTDAYLAKRPSLTGIAAHFYPYVSKERKFIPAIKAVTAMVCVQVETARYIDTMANAFAVELADADVSSLE